MIQEAAVEAIHGAICDESLEDHLDPDWPGRCVKAVEAAMPRIGFALMDELRRVGQHEASDLVGQLTDAT